VRRAEIRLGNRSCCRSHSEKCLIIFCGANPCSLSSDDSPSTGLVSVNFVMFLNYMLVRAWRLARTRALWSWRFHSLGTRSTIGRCRLVCNSKAVSIGHHTSLCDDWCLVDLNPASEQSNNPKIRIGSYCSILHDFQCNANVSIEVQDYVLIAPRVFITDSDHIVDESGGRTTLCNSFRSAAVVIEHDCWLGVNAVVLKGVRIGHHSTVGANSVVTRDVPPFSIVAGVPARIIGETGSR
jgi:acetyltransferase-like isoleucine patch superfamily enzyme